MTSIESNNMESLLLLKKTAESLAMEIRGIRKRSSTDRKPMSKYQRERYRRLENIASVITGEIGKLEALEEERELV